MSTQRELKFRVWDNVDYMSKPFTLQSMNNAERTEFTSDCVVMQYTGLRDRNGREIYEGDVVQEVYEESECGPAAAFATPVVFMDGAFCLDDGEPLFELQEDKDHDWQVIGNIHENPELVAR